MSKKIKKIKFKPRIEKVEDEEDNNIISPWRIFKIMGEFVNGFEFLKTYDAAVTFFGTARVNAANGIFEEATKLARALSDMGFAIITGGGPGVMEAANKGAFEADGVSVGINIQLPHEQRVNQYVKQSQAFHYFFTRKVMLAYASEIYIFFPGGYGTMDELFEILTLVQTKKICGIPVILVNKEYWGPLVNWIKTTVMEKNKNIDEEDFKLFTLVDNADEAIAYINKLVKQKKIATQEKPIEYTEENKIQK